MEIHPIRLPRRVSPGRVAAVTLGLVGGGALAGAIAGALGATLWIALTDGPRAALDPAVWFFAGSVGAPFGAVLLPLAGFTALRRVPLGRLLAVTVTATALGGTLGAFTTPEGWLVGAIAGFLSATGFLWYRSRARVTQRSSDDVSGRLPSGVA
jgi:hypothetical protein